MARRRWQWVIVPTMLVVAYAAILSQRPRSRDVLDELVAADDARRAAQRRKFVAWGELRDGRMVDHYRRATEPLLDALDERRALWDISGEELFACERTAARRAVWREAMREISAGAHARDASFVVGELVQSPALHVPLAFELELSLLLMEGDDEAAVRLTLDVMTMFVDCWHYLSDSFGVILVARAVDCWTEDRRVCLDAAVRASFDAGLQTLVRRLREPCSMGDVFPSFARWLAMEKWSVQDRLAAWRHGFDPEQRFRDALCQAIELAPSLDGDIAVVEQRVANSKTMLSDHGADFYGWGLHAEQARREALAALLSLRAALE